MVLPVLLACDLGTNAHLWKATGQGVEGVEGGTPYI